MVGPGFHRASGSMQDGSRPCLSGNPSSTHRRIQHPWEAVFFLAFPQCLFPAPAVRDVLCDTDDPGYSSGLFCNGNSAVPNCANGTVGMKKEVGLFSDLAELLQPQTVQNLLNTVGVYGIQEIRRLLPESLPRTLPNVFVGRADTENPAIFGRR